MGGVTARTDLHQHAWPVELLDALAERCGPGPRARQEGDSTWVLELQGEPDHPLDERQIDLHRRSGALFAAGLDRALLVPPLAIGLDALPDVDESRGLLATWSSAVRGFATPHGSSFAAWAAVPAADPDPRDLERQLADGAVGLALPAPALADAAALDRVGPVLEALARAGRPLLVHPAPPAADAAAATAAWRPALVDYPAQLLAAWATWLERGLDEHPDLRVAFAALAGGAPLLLERLAARGGPVDRARDERLVYETSSFGPRALAAAAQAVGADRLGFGSDRPVVAPGEQHPPAVAGLDPARLTTVAAARLLGESVAAGAPVAPALELVAEAA